MRIDRLELKLPPPLVAGLAAAFMYGLYRLSPAWTWPFPYRLPIGIALLGIGGCLIVAAIYTLRRSHTTLSPTSPADTSHIVDSGIYRVSRNPIYLGALALLTALALYLSHPLALAVLPVFVLYITRFQIIPEERILLEKFGDEYARYLRTVRRWL
ncbi:MAG: isoprenylcysteine carboxylmethyltransferase family protein [Xanthomonadaceae bacterium]|jgi:protein-S-isoprenylcysteine O-methyltransferase Ste14|nr:isoprenylcysteine carboxylmethyltransferase family protein [Xanthomonadaceae bacterium]